MFFEAFTFFLDKSAGGSCIPVKKYEGDAMKEFIKVMHAPEKFTVMPC